MFFHIFGALAEYERELIRERTKAGLTAARARGRKGGRKPAMNYEQIEQARAMMDNPKLEVKSIINPLGVSKATLYKYVLMGKSARTKNDHSKPVKTK
jgi:DNA invertase Pin-like site-specific DNA recombinase